MMSRRHRIHCKRRHRVVRQGAPSAEPAHVPASPPASLPAQTAVTPPAPVASLGPGGAAPDDFAMPRVVGVDEGSPIDLDRLVPEAVLAVSSGAGLCEPPALIVGGPEGAARRRARDERDGVEVADPRRGPLYVVIALFVAILVFAVLSLIETRELPASLAP